MVTWLVGRVSHNHWLRFFFNRLLFPTHSFAQGCHRKAWAGLLTVPWLVSLSLSYLLTLFAISSGATGPHLSLFLAHRSYFLLQIAFSFSFVVSGHQHLHLMTENPANILSNCLRRLRVLISLLATRQTTHLRLESADTYLFRSSSSPTPSNTEEAR